MGTWDGASTRQVMLLGIKSLGQVLRLGTTEIRSLEPQELPDLHVWLAGELPHIPLHL